MFPYRAKYTKSESDKKKNSLFYKNTKKQHAFETLEKLKIEINKYFYFVSCINCIIHIVFFGKFVVSGFLDFYINLLIY